MSRGRAPATVAALPALLRDHWDTDAVGGRKVEKLTVLVIGIQSLDEMEEATMGSKGDGGDGDGGADESGGSGLGATDGTSATAGVARSRSVAVVAKETDTLGFFAEAWAMNVERTLGDTMADEAVAATSRGVVFEDGDDDLGDVCGSAGWMSS